MLLLSPLACWADQNDGSNEYEFVPETQSDSSDQTAAVADETAPSIDAAVEPKEAAPDVCVSSRGFEQKEHRKLSSLSIGSAHAF